MLVFPVSHFKTPIHRANLCCHLDAGNSDSYAGGSGQTWANLVKAPADGALQAAYDFVRGATDGAQASDPTFNGTAGRQTSAEYFSFDGGDYFAFAGANTTFLNTWHRNAAALSWEMWLYSPGASTGANLFGGTRNSTDQGINFSDQGACFYSTGSAFATISGTLALNSGAWQQIGLSWSENGGASGAFFVKNGVAQTAFNPNLTSPGSGDGSYPYKLCTAGDALVTFVPNNFRLAIVRIYNAALTAAQFKQNFNAQRQRFAL